MMDVFYGKQMNFSLDTTGRILAIDVSRPHKHTKTLTQKRRAWAHVTPPTLLKKADSIPFRMAFWRKSIVLKQLRTSIKIFLL